MEPLSRNQVFRKSAWFILGVRFEGDISAVSNWLLKHPQEKLSDEDMPIYDANRKARQMLAARPKLPEEWLARDIMDDPKKSAIFSEASSRALLLPDNVMRYASDEQVEEPYKKAIHKVSERLRRKYIHREAEIQELAMQALRNNTPLSQL